MNEIVSEEIFWLCLVGIFAFVVSATSGMLSEWFTRWYNKNFSIPKASNIEKQAWKFCFLFLLPAALVYFTAFCTLKVGEKNDLKLNYIYLCALPKEKIDPKILQQQKIFIEKRLGRDFVLEE